MTTMSVRSPDYTANQAPGQEGRIDEGFENLKVKLLHWPDYNDFVRLMTKAAHAVTGSIIEDETIDFDMVEDLFRGGLNQSLEWVGVVFECSGVSRGLTHQLVRTRKASFAQQSMRYADMGNFNVRMPEDIAANPQATAVWLQAIQATRTAYSALANMGIPIQSARTVCPIATETYIICSYPLSEFIALYSYRACQMFYPEMVELMSLMKTALLYECPWLSEHIKISCEKTAGGINGLPHKCTYQGFERVEGQCTFEWALEANRTYKSRKVDK